MNNIFLFWEDNNQELYAEHNFKGIMTGGESWFLYTTYGDSVFAISAREVVPRTKQNIYDKKTMVTIFFTSTRLWCWISSQKAPSSIKIILLIRCFPVYTAKRDELRGARLCRVFQSTWTIQCVITTQRSLKTCEETHCASSSPTSFTRSHPLWLLVIWNLEAEDEGVSFSERITKFGRYRRELEWAHIRGHPESFP
jgi:hypothetical protein